MAITRADLLKEMVPGLNALFDLEYSKHRVTEDYRISMPRRGRYQVWGGTKLYADRIKHRKQALAMAKLLKGNEQYDL